MSAKTENVSPLNEERTGNVREVGGEAVWSLSSCKPGKFSPATSKSLILISFYSQDLAWNNYETIQPRRIGSRTDNCHIWSTSSSLARRQSVTFTSFLTINWMKVTLRAEFRLDRERISMICRKLRWWTCVSRVDGSALPSKIWERSLFGPLCYK